MGRTVRFGGVRVALACAALVLGAALAVSAGMFVPQAFANKTISAPTTADGSTMTVSDDVTRIHVDKVDTDNHEAVKGAKMQIIEKDSGKVVDEWTTDGSTHAFEKGLDVNVVYILHEDAAPDGYGAIDDVEFMANEIEGTGLTLITESDSVELTDAYKVTLYEPREAEVKIVTEEKTTPSKATTPKTGDGLLLVAVVLVICGAAACVILLVARRKVKEE